ncbi:MinD/ParA family protein [Kitasatospora sp. NPDC093102]|uniref:MinD/ParA family ATP-binding protein n=1 Tax=Kitasatospora sp. NPDC093102 TaxID=3155069 RepID=UPI0034252EBE
MTVPSVDRRTAAPGDDPVVPGRPERSEPLDTFGTVLIPATARAAVTARRDDPPVPAARPADSPKAAPARPSPEALRPADLLAGRRPLPRFGLPFGLRVGRGQRQDAQLAAIRTQLHQNYRVAVVSLKGGVGKTATTLALGATLATHRSDRVITVDASPSSGTADRHGSERPRGRLAELVAALPAMTSERDLRPFVSRTADGLELLAHDSDPNVTAAFHEVDYRKVMRLLGREYPVILTDTGTGLLASVMRGVLDLADQVVVATTPSVDGAITASTTLDWLAAQGYGDLVGRSVTVVTELRKAGRLIRTEDVVTHFRTRCRDVVVVPFDEHLSAGAGFELDDLNARTRDAYLELAATVAADMPRVRPTA